MFDLETELGQLGDEALGFELGGAVVEMMGAEVLMIGPSLSMW